MLVVVKSECYLVGQLGIKGAGLAASVVLLGTKYYCVRPVALLRGLRVRAVRSDVQGQEVGGEGGGSGGRGKRSLLCCRLCCNLSFVVLPVNGSDLCGYDFFSDVV